MSTFIEAMLLLLPADAGGRSAPVAPREGSYRPFARHGPRTVRARVFEGPTQLAPGEEDRVMLELESDIGVSAAARSCRSSSATSESSGISPSCVSVHYENDRIVRTPSSRRVRVADGRH